MSLSERLQATPHKVLFFDIETAPSLAYIWSAKTRYVGAHQIRHETFLLTWAYKWGHEDEVVSKKMTKAEAIAQDDRRLVESLAKVIREADWICGHNVDRFDLPMLNNRVLLHDLEPLGNVKTIDTLKLAKKSFRLMSNKLDWLAQQMGFGHKISTDFDLWARCYRGDTKALAEMLEYNEHDVVLLQQVYERLAPHVKGLPRLVDATHNGQFACPSCGSRDLEEAGVYRTNASTFDKFYCPDCKRYCRTRVSKGTRKLAVVPL